MKCLLILVLVFFSTLSLAEDTYTDPIDDYAYSDPVSYSINGYVYQGFNKTNYNNIDGGSSSSGGSVATRDIGLLGYYGLNSHIDFRGFVKWKQRGDRLLNYPSFSYALVDIHSNTFSNTLYGVRYGQIRNSLGFFNSTMENPVTRDMDRLPQSIYRTTLEGFINSSFGYQLYLHTDSLPLTNLTLEVSNTRPNFEPNEDVKSAWFDIQPTGIFDGNASKAIGLSITAATKDLHWVARYDTYTSSAMYVAGKNDFIPSGDLGIKISLLGIRRYFDNWDITYEYVRSNQKGLGWAVIDPVGSISKGQSFMVRYNRNSKLTYITGFNEWYSDTTDMDGLKANLAHGVLPANSYLRDYSIGFNYRPTRNFIFKGSYHKLEGLIGLSPIDNPTYLYTASPTDNLYHLSITYSF
jgi:hypothetical protein